MQTVNPAFVSRSLARSYRTIVNAKAKAAGSVATLRDPVKDSDGLWVFPGLNHGSKLSMSKGK